MLRLVPRRLRHPAFAWVGIAALLIVVQYVAAHWSPSPPYTTEFFSGWNRYDGPQYLHIVTFGYTYTPGTLPYVAWFPGFPLAIRLVHQVVSDPLVAGVLVSAAAGLVAVCLLWRWTAVLDVPPAARATVMAVALLYPYGWFLYGVVYSDSLFLAFALAAFLLMEADHPGWAGLAGAVATATRVNGVALVAGLLVLGLERSGALSFDPSSRYAFVRRFRVPTRFRRTAVRPRTLLVLASVGGLVAYMVYLRVRWGDPLLFYRVQIFWNHGPAAGWRSLAKFDLLGGLLEWTHPAITLTSAAQAILTAATLVAAPFVGRRYGWGYGVYAVTTVVIIFVSSADFLGAGRYLISLFPMAALAGEWLTGRPRTRWAVLVASGVLLVFLDAAWARNAYLT